MKFPKNPYVKIEGRPGEQYFDPHRSIDTMVDAGESATVGVYQLVNTVKAHGSVTVVSTKPLRTRQKRG